MTPSSWPCPLPGGGIRDEMALTFDAGRPVRLLIVPALFDEGNRMRRFTVEVMRRLDARGIDSFLPDLPGCNESLQRLELQDPADWLDATAAAARHYAATHALGLRGGCLFTPARLPAIHYAPVKAAAILRQMVRARILASREAGRTESREHLAEAALARGIVLAGYRLGADFYRHFEAMAPAGGAKLVAQEQVGGAGLWLRAEPDENADQASALAAIVAQEIAA
ncbi:alpha/beta hydrolase family protein [Novosphingobium soli]|uniref:Alpha/beta hydrolase n=1 Tax=Novosphingobium soli TaxID=574956 RepID=A0ABV6CVQ6_9SPHN